MEKSEKWTDYERKEGHFWTSEDTWDVSKQRFAPFRENQERLIQAVRRTNDREIVVWYNPSGNIGKSWLLGAMWERGIAHFVAGEQSIGRMIQDVAAEYINNGFRELVVLDIPRSWKWDDDLYTALERIKDGLIKDTRYSPHPINIRGVKVLVCCNTAPNVKKLSADRLIIIREDSKNEKLPRKTGKQLRDSRNVPFQHAGLSGMERPAGKSDRVLGSDNRIRNERGSDQRNAGMREPGDGHVTLCHPPYPPLGG